MRIYGIDFTSRHWRGKPISCLECTPTGAHLVADEDCGHSAELFGTGKTQMEWHWASHWSRVHSGRTIGHRRVPRLFRTSKVTPDPRSCHAL